MWPDNARVETWAELTRPWDLVVVGGGIVGAGIMREAARRGLRVLLLEQRDFAWGTSSRSSKFVHGGLRYLKDLQIKLAWKAVRGREHLLSDASGLVHPIEFLLTRHRGDKLGRVAFKVALSIYDLLAGRREHRRFNIEQLRMLVPQISEENLLDSFASAEGRTDDSRLTLRVLGEGIAAGGRALNYARVESLLRENDQAVGVQVSDAMEKRAASVQARVVVNATGAWADQLRGQVVQSKIIRPLRGSHLVFAGWRVPVAQVVMVNHPVDKRPVTIAPWHTVTLVGSTDVDHHESLEQEPHITPQEVAYLMSAVEYAFPQLALDLKDVMATYSGVRPVIDSGKADPSKESRDDVVLYERGLLTVTGGKLTTFQSTALEALKLIPREVLSIPLTRTAPALDPVRIDLDLPEPLRSRLLGRYGNLAQQVVALAGPGELEFVPGTDVLWIELKWAACNEAVIHLDDLLLRRVALALVLPQGARALLPRIRTLCQPELGWNDERWETEQSNYIALWDRCYSLPDPALVPDWKAWKGTH